MVSKIEFFCENSFLNKLQFSSLLAMALSYKKNFLSLVIIEGRALSFHLRHSPTQHTQVILRGINYEQQLQNVLF